MGTGGNWRAEADATAPAVQTTAVGAPMAAAAAAEAAAAATGVAAAAAAGVAAAAAAVGGQGKLPRSRAADPARRCPDGQWWAVLAAVGAGGRILRCALQACFGRLEVAESGEARGRTPTSTFDDKN